MIVLGIDPARVAALALVVGIMAVLAGAIASDHIKREQLRSSPARWAAVGIFALFAVLCAGYWLAMRAGPHTADPDLQTTCQEPLGRSPC